jgi:hypothetical protein
VPYVADSRRPMLRPHHGPAVTAGELNYQLTRLVNAYIEEHGLEYRTINDVLGALEGAKLEFYRRVAVPYEDGKIAQNGDVYTTLPGPTEGIPPVCENCV